MPIEITWMTPNRILLVCGAEPITEHDMQVFVEELQIILDSATRLIHTVMDLTLVKTITESAPYIYYASRILDHPRRGRIGMVQANFQGRVHADIINRISGREMFRLFESRDAARAFLLAHDSPPPAFAANCEATSSSDPDEGAPAEAGRTC